MLEIIVEVAFSQNKGELGMAHYMGKIDLWLILVSHLHTRAPCDIVANVRDFSSFTL